MEVTIKGSAKEIAALALELQERRVHGISLSEAREIARKVKQYDGRVNSNQSSLSSASAASSRAQ
ncbi:MAG: hypothetical protein MR743_03745 [Oscillospiraceae bacterium]|nr:hypothetical protein [Oscillospiraceae bacterium]